jgi:hypothetical protein
MDVNVGREDILKYKTFAPAWLVEHLVGCGHGCCAVRHGGEMKLMTAHRFPSSQQAIALQSPDGAIAQGEAGSLDH